MLLGLIGRPCAGKDTAAAVLQRSGWSAIAFADALRIEVSAAWGIDIRALTDRAARETPRARLAAAYGNHPAWLTHVLSSAIAPYEARSPRWVLQQWGQWRRTQDPDYWTKHVRAWIDIQRARRIDRLVVTDVRHQDEADMIASRAGHIVRVHRPDLPAMDPATASHPSEQHTAIAAADDIHNDGSLAHLEAEVWRVVAALPTHTPTEESTP